jgi:hypothetical protein
MRKLPSVQAPRPAAARRDKCTPPSTPPRSMPCVLRNICRFAHASGVTLITGKMGLLWVGSGLPEALDHHTTSTALLVPGVSSVSPAQPTPWNRPKSCSNITLWLGLAPSRCCHGQTVLVLAEHQSRPCPAPFQYLQVSMPLCAPWRKGTPQGPQALCIQASAMPT